MRTEEALKYLKECGEIGMSTEELSTKFGYKYPNSISKVIKQLRELGHEITLNKETGKFTLTKEADTEEPLSSSEVGSEISEEDTGDAKDDELFYRVSNKRDKLLEYLIRAGKEGGNHEELSRYSGIKSSGICYHIYALRKKGISIFTKGGRYYVRDNSKNPKYNTGTKSLPVSDIPVDLLNLLGDKRLVNNINKLRKEELPTYLDFLKKIIFYTKCALAMYETRDMLDTLTIGEEA